MSDRLNKKLQEVVIVQKINENQARNEVGEWGCEKEVVWRNIKEVTSMGLTNFCFLKDK